MGRKLSGGAVQGHEVSPLRVGDLLTEPALLRGRGPVASPTSPTCARSPQLRRGHPQFSLPQLPGPPMLSAALHSQESPGRPWCLSLPLGQQAGVSEGLTCMSPVSQLHCLVLPAVQYLKSTIWQVLSLVSGRRVTSAPVTLSWPEAETFTSERKKRLCHPEERDRTALARLWTCSHREWDTCPPRIPGWAGLAPVGLPGASLTTLAQAGTGRRRVPAMVPMVTHPSLLPAPSASKTQGGS